MCEYVICECVPSMGGYEWQSSLTHRADSGCSLYLERSMDLLRNFRKGKVSCLSLEPFFSFSVRCHSIEKLTILLQIFESHFCHLIACFPFFSVFLVFVLSFILWLLVSFFPFW